MRHEPSRAERGTSLREASLTRRHFLLGGAASAAVALLAACSNKNSRNTSAPAATTGASQAATDTPAPAPSPALRQFIALSAVLTGVSLDVLDPGAAQGFLTALQTPPAGGMTVVQLAVAAGIPVGGSGTAPSFADLTAKGVLTPPAERITADAIATNWYSGQVAATGAGKAPSVITYNGALGWKALDFAMAPALCGGVFGFWSAKPAA